MFESEKKQESGSLEQVGLVTSASVLQATFEHYFRMAMDHHTKAGTTSNFLLIIVAAIIGLVSAGGEIGGTVDFLGGLTVFVIGLFGAAWTWKQHERYYFWQHIAYEYQKELKGIVPGLKTGMEYKEGAEEDAANKYGSITVKAHERWLWVSLHVLIAVVGLGLMVLAVA